MINIIRKNQKALMILITVLVIISFVWFYNGNRNNDRSRGADAIATIYSHTVTTPEFDREVRRFYIANQLGLSDLVRNLASGNDMNQAIESFIWNLMVLRHEAERLQAIPSDEEIKSALRDLDVFKTGGSFDPQKLDAFVQKELAARGFTATVIDELLRDSLQLKKVKELVGSSVSVSPAEFRATYEQGYQKAQVSVIRFSLADLISGVTVTDDEVKKIFEQRADLFKTEEKRKVKFATLGLSETEAALKGRERVDALQKLADRAQEFTQAMLDKKASFDAVAAQFKAPVAATGEFTENAPDPTLEKAGAAATTAAFKLTAEDPNSDVLQAGNSFYILHLEQAIPSRPLTLEEAKPLIVKQLKIDRARELISTKAVGIRGKLEAALKGGQSMGDAAKAENLNAEPVPPFSLVEQPDKSTPDLQPIVAKSIELKDGQISEFIPTQEGGLLVYLEKRLPIDEAKFEKQKALEKISKTYLGGKQTIAFREWLRTRVIAAKIQAIGRK